MAGQRILVVDDDREIARLLDCPESTVKSRLYEGLSRLRSRLSGIESGAAAGVAAPGGGGDQLGGIPPGTALPTPPPRLGGVGGPSGGSSVVTGVTVVPPPPHGGMQMAFGTTLAIARMWAAALG